MRQDLVLAGQRNGTGVRMARIYYHLAAVSRNSRPPHALAATSSPATAARLRTMSRLPVKANRTDRQARRAGSWPPRRCPRASPASPVGPRDPRDGEARPAPERRGPPRPWRQPPPGTPRRGARARPPPRRAGAPCPDSRRRPPAPVPRGSCRARRSGTRPISPPVQDSAVTSTRPRRSSAPEQELRGACLAPAHPDRAQPAREALEARLPIGRRPAPEAEGDPVLVDPRAPRHPLAPGTAAAPPPGLTQAS